MAKQVKAKKYIEHENPEHKVSKWSDGFADKKGGKKDKKNKSTSTTDLEFEDGTVMLIDSAAKCNSITGKVSFFAINGGTLEVNGKRKV